LIYLSTKEYKTHTLFRYESMILTLKEFKKQYKSVENYLLECNFNIQEIEIIKNNLIINNVNNDNFLIYNNSVGFIKSLL
jgi:hypothetical protein